MSSIRFISILITMFAFLPTAKAADTTEPIKIRWVLAHEPVELFQRAAADFAKSLSEKTHGRMQVEVLTVSEYAKKYNHGKTLNPSDVVQYIRKDKIEMSQTYTTSLGVLNKDMYVLDLPFLFRDHQHAAKVLEGPTGQMLMAGLEKGRVKGLAFTYSGGYRVIPAKTAIRSMDDFKGMKIRTSGSPVAQDTFLAIGAKPVPMELEDIGKASKQGLISGAESTYPRFYTMRQNEFSTVLNETDHSLFLTTIVVGEDFWNKLTPDLQKAVSESALAAGRQERAESIEDAENIKAKCKKDGVEVAVLPAAEVAKFKTATASVYKKYEHYFSQDDLVSQIQKQ